MSEGPDSVFATLRSVVINPIALSVLAGGALAFLRVGLPTPVSRLAETLAGAAAPCALFAIGLALNGKERLLREGHIRKSEVSALVVLKLIIHPAIVAALATYLFKMQDLWRDVAILMAALPVGVTSYVLAQRYAIYADETASTILLSTILW